jgi:hypothetical protein
MNVILAILINLIILEYPEKCNIEQKSRQFPGKTALKTAITMDLPQDIIMKLLQIVMLCININNLIIKS